jgi:hypothetical protein
MEDRVNRARSLLRGVVLAIALVSVAHADPAPFDLAGPNLQVKVSRGATTLPIGEVPNLLPGDRVWIKAELPSTQLAQYLMVVAFLRGSTNPPPKGWFTPCETWAGQCMRNGVTVTVPEDAEQVLVFLAPRTGGDFGTLVDAVRGRPGAFVRSSQDLNQAMLDRSRLEAYLSTIRALDDADQTRLKEVTPLVARSLAIKVNDKCLDKIPELQAPCLMQGQESLILNDGHSTSIVEALTSGPASDLAMEASYTPQLSYGYYSPYLASVLDIGRLLGSFHTAQYQYIPALASPRGAEVALTLNTPPSFHNPKSVLVAALPAVEQPQPPPLHAVDPKDIYCARKTSLVLPVEGAPLVFSTSYAHDIALSVTGANGNAIELPVRADAQQGGFAVDTSALGTASLGDGIHGALHGWWGFDEYRGPQFELVNARAQSWKVDAEETAALIAGREETVHLQATGVSCVDNVRLRDSSGQELKTEWKAVKPDEIELKLPLQAVPPGPISVLVSQYGTTQPQQIDLQAFSEAGHFSAFVVHAGDAQGTLLGSRLDEVASLLLKGIQFLPVKLSSTHGSDELTMVTQDVQAATALKAGDSLKSKVMLKDGRVLSVAASVVSPRPSAMLIDTRAFPAPSSGVSNIQLTDRDELPQDAKLIFSIRTQSPRTFARAETVEVATADQAFSTLLSLDNGAMTLETSSVAVATLDPVRAFGPSAFGALQFRVVVDGVAGDWQPLATLVRLPLLQELQCPATPEVACKLSGSNLYLVDSVSDDPHFAHAVPVPDGFPGKTLPVPHTTDGKLYVKLRDDASVVNLATLTLQELPPSAEELARAAARHAASLAPVNEPSKSPTGPATLTPEPDPDSSQNGSTQAAPPPDQQLQTPAPAPQSPGTSGRAVTPVMPPTPG